MSSWVTPLLRALERGELTNLEVWDVVLSCADHPDPAPIVDRLLVALARPLPAADTPIERPRPASVWDEAVVIVDDHLTDVI